MSEIVMESINLNFAKTTRNYVESAQTSSIRFSPVYISDNEYYQGWHNVRCRDKMNDLPAIIHWGASIPYINGFRFLNPELFENYGDTLMVSVSFGNTKDKESFENKFKLFTDFEERYGLRKSELILTQKENTFLIKSDMFWCQSVLTISLYTFLLRILSYGNSISESKFGKAYDSTINTKLEDILPILYNYYDNDMGDFNGIDGRVSQLLTETLTDIDTLMRYIPYLLADNPISGLNDELLKESIINKEKSDSMKGQIVIFEYESSKILPLKVNIDWERSTLHASSGFYSLLGQVRYALRGRKIGMRLSTTPDWAVKYIELLYTEGRLSSNLYISDNFKLGDT